MALKIVRRGPASLSGARRQQGQRIGTIHRSPGVVLRVRDDETSAIVRWNVGRRAGGLIARATSPSWAKSVSRVYRTRQFGQNDACKTSRCAARGEQPYRRRPMGAFCWRVAERSAQT